MELIIHNHSEEPIYEQIVNQIKNKIMTKELIPGEPLPSIRGLARDLRISVITTKRAYEELEREGYIETVAGKGSFISSIDETFHLEEVQKKIEEHLLTAVHLARYTKMALPELIDLVTYFYEEEQNEK